MTICIQGYKARVSVSLVGIIALDPGSLIDAYRPYAKEQFMDALDTQPFCYG